MNYCIFNGYVENKYAYGKTQDGDYKFDFFASVENDDGIARPVPFRCYGNMATEVYSKLQVGYYVEITCKYVRIDNITNYFVVKDLCFKKPKSSRQYYIKASELLEIYTPKNVLERLNKANGKK